ncbi:ABC transporter substrate-binding protein [Myxosarcina sp. GI1]|uniref:ABC transporter substrate-binding protein n=1 Tax=Myxosarcina sp. GI1 TaxID=1541065 RepID=UPI0006925B8C|nr:ABC transporter substrate-binding protein [Myxosarcina sp. GI1]
MKDLFPKKQVPLNSNRSPYKSKTTFELRIIIILGILAMTLVAIWSANRHQKAQTATNRQSSISLERPRFFSRNKPENLALDQRLSLGERILVKADNNPAKQSAVAKYASGMFYDAQRQFRDSLTVFPNDPEALIYLNNSYAAAEPNTVTIGVSVPIGGSLDVSQEILRGVAQAQNEINQEGGVNLNGKRSLVQIQVANDDNYPETAREIATNFINNPQIIGVIGHNSSDSSIAAAPIYEKAGLVMVSPTSVAREISHAGDYIFRTTPSSRALASTLAEYAANTIHRKKVAICNDSASPASTSFQEEFSLTLFELGGEIVASNCDFASGGFNPDAAISEAIANGAETLLVIPSVNNINQALEVARANRNRLPILGNHSMYTYETLNVGQDDINGLVLPVAWHPAVTKGSDFNQGAIKLWGMEGSWRTAMAYDAAKAIFAGLDLAENRQQLRQVLSNPGFNSQGATGKVEFLPSGDRKMEATLVKVQSGSASGTGYDFVPISSGN